MDYAVWFHFLVLKTVWYKMRMSEPVFGTKIVRRFNPDPLDQLNKNGFFKIEKLYVEQTASRQKHLSKL